MALTKEEERIYIENPERKTQFNHVTIKIRIVTLLKLEQLKESGDMRVEREREMHLRHMWESEIWAQILEKESIQHLPAVVLIVANPNDSRDEIKKVILKMVNEKERKVKLERM